MNEQHDNQLQNTRTLCDPATLKQAILDHLYYTQARPANLATLNDWYMAVAYTVRDRMMKNWVSLISRLGDKDLKIVGYLSAEFLMGPHLGNALINLGIYDEIKEAIESCGPDFQQVLSQEEEPGLGNGGLGRLAACYLDSLTTLKVPSLGYGIRYEFGIFDQYIGDGWQVERTDKWLLFGNPWEIARPEVRFNVKLGGHTESYADDKGKYRVRWTPEYQVAGMAYDTPVPGYKNQAVNMLRLWKSEAIESQRLCPEAAGHLNGSIQCRYHAWTYGLDGRLIGAPNVLNRPEFERARVSRRRDIEEDAIGSQLVVIDSYCVLADEAGVARI